MSSLISRGKPLKSKLPPALTLEPDLILLSEAQAAEITGKAVSTLQKARVSGGGIPYVKLGRSVRYRLSDIRAYIAGNMRGSTSDSGRDVA